MPQQQHALTACSAANASAGSSQYCPCLGIACTEQHQVILAHAVPASATACTHSMRTSQRKHWPLQPMPFMPQPQHACSFQTSNSACSTTACSHSPCRPCHNNSMLTQRAYQPCKYWPSLPMLTQHAQTRTCCYSMLARAPLLNHACLGPFATVHYVQPARLKPTDNTCKRGDAPP